MVPIRELWGDVTEICGDPEGSEDDGESSSREIPTLERKKVRFV
jgi:hypothetical protein